MLRWIVGAAALIAACGGGDNSSGGSAAPISLGGVEYSAAEVRDLLRNDIAESGWDEACAELLEVEPGKRAEMSAGMVAIGVVPDEETAVRFIALGQEVCNDERP